MSPKIGGQKIAEYPWQMVSIDYVGPLVRSKKATSRDNGLVFEVFSVVFGQGCRK
jgi:hypothetical protein